MSEHLGSADSVVFPVPDKPKNKATFPLEFTFAEQCIGKTPFSGRRKFWTENIDFFISPAYFIPARITFLFAKFIITQLSEFVPSSEGSQTKLAALNICHSCLLAGL